MSVKTRARRLLSLFLSACLIGLTVGSVVGVSEVGATSTPQNPTFIVDRGSAPGLLKVLFTPSAGIDYYVLRLYPEINGYENAAVGYALSPSSSGIDIGSEGSYSAPNCNYEIICNQLRGGKGMKFTIQGYDSANEPVTSESAKTVTHYSLNPNLNQVTVQPPIDSETASLSVSYTPATGNSSMSLRLFQATDSYSSVYQEVSGIGASGRSIDVAGGTSYKYSFRTMGSTTNNAVYISSGWTALSLSGQAVYKRPNPPANVAIETSDRRLTATWDTPVAVSGVTVMAYSMGVSTDKLTWIDIQTSSSVRSFIFETFNGSRVLVNGTAYWVRLRTIGSFGVKKTWYSTTQYIPSWVPGPPTDTTATTGDRRIDVTWVAPRDTGGAPITGYKVQHSTDGTNWTTADVSASTLSYTISGLTNGTAYTVRVRTVNMTGTSDSFAEHANKIPAGTPKPKTLPVTNIGTTTATISLELDSKGNTVTPSLRFKTLLGADREFSGNAQNSSTISYSEKLTGLTPGYFYEVESRALGGTYDERGAKILFSTTPNPPSNLSATMSGTSAAVSWTLSQVNYPDGHAYQVWAEQNGVEVGNRCTSFPNPGNSCEITGLSPGRNYVIKATTSSIGANYGNGTSFPSSISVNTLADQTITFSFGTLPRKGASSPPFDISEYASSSSGLSISFSSQTLSVCSIVGRIVQTNTGGTCTIRASQSGNSRYAAAASVDASFSVLSAQTITFNVSSLGNQTVDATPIDLSAYASASSGLAVSFYSVTRDKCTVDGTTVSFVGMGFCHVVASQSGNGTYQSATNVSRILLVLRGTQSTVTLTSTTGTYGTSLALTSSGGSGTGVLSYAIDTDSQSATATGCYVFMNFLSATSAGKCAVIATKAADGNYYSKSSSSTLVTLGKASQTITFKPIAGSGNLIVGQTTSTDAQSTSGLSVAVTSDTESKCTVSGNTVSLVADGVCTLRGTQSGNSNYLAASEVTVSFEISPKPIPSVSAIDYTRRFNPDTYRVGDTVALSVAPATYSGSPVPGSFEFISTAPNSFSFGTPTVDEDGTTRVSVTFHRANAAFNLYAVFTPTDSVTFAQAQTFAAIQVGARQQTITVSGGTAENGVPLPVNFSGIQSTGQVFIDRSPMNADNQAIDISDQQDHCTIVNKTVTRDNPGTCYVRVSSLGDGVSESSSGVAAFTFTKLVQTIVISNPDKLESLTATSINTSIDISAIFTTTAPTDQSLTVAVESLTTSVCTIANSEVTVKSAGTCTLKLNQSGNTSYLAAEERIYSFNITPLEQAPLSLSSTTTTFGTGLTLTASGGSGTGQVTYTVSDGLATGCVIQNGVLSSSTSGTCLVEISKAGDDTYLPKSSPTQQVEISRATQNFTFNLSTIGSPQLGTASVDLTQYATTNASGAISFTTADSDACRVSGTVVEWLAAGTCSITAVHFGTEDYAPASEQTQVVVQSVASPTAPTVNAPAPVNPSTSANSPGPTDVASPSNAATAPVAPLMRAQTAPSTPKTAKRGKTIRFTMKAPSGLPLKVRATGGCRSSAVTRIVVSKKKVGSRTVPVRKKVQTGWLVSFTKKGSCTVSFQNNGDSAYLPLSAVAKIKVT